MGHEPGLTGKVMQRPLCTSGACSLEDTFGSLTSNEIVSLMVLQLADQLL